MKDKKLLTVFLLSGVAVLIVIIAVLGIMMLLNNKKPAEDIINHEKSIDGVERIIEEGNYDQEALTYIAALESDPNNKEARDRLSELYDFLSDEEKEYVDVIFGRRSLTGNVSDGSSEDTSDDAEETITDASSDRLSSDGGSENTAAGSFCDVVFRVTRSDNGIVVPYVTVSLNSPYYAETVLTNFQGIAAFTGVPYNTALNIEVAQSGFETKRMSLFFEENEDPGVQEISLSPEIVSGEVKIVLEWGIDDADLDAHLESYQTGAALVNRNRREWYLMGRLAASLESDSSTRYAPEIVKIYDLIPDYTFVVEDFSETGEMYRNSNVTVTVYMSPTESPTVFRISSAHRGSDPNRWTVFSIINGHLVY